MEKNIYEYLERYSKASKHPLLIGVQHPERNSVIVFKVEKAVDLIEGVKLRSESSKKGGCLKTDLRPSKTIVRKWLTLFPIECEIDETQFDTFRKEKRFHNNRGHALEAWLLERHFCAGTWKPSNDRFDTSPDIFIGGVGYQVKSERSTFSNENIIANAEIAIEKNGAAIKAVTVEKVRAFFNEYRYQPIVGLTDLCRSRHIDKKTVMRYCNYKTFVDYSQLTENEYTEKVKGKPYLEGKTLLVDKGKYYEKVTTYIFTDILL